MFAFIFDNISFGEWAVLIVVFLIVVGPRKIPQTARTIGNYYSKLRRAAESFKRQLMDIETEFNKAADEVESGAKELEDAFSSEGDESESIPPPDAYYSSDGYGDGDPFDDDSFDDDGMPETDSDDDALKPSDGGGTDSAEATLNDSKTVLSPDAQG